MKPIIKIENVSKQYRLGLTGTGTFSHDVNRWWHSICGKERYPKRKDVKGPYFWLFYGQVFNENGMSPA